MREADVLWIQALESRLYFAAQNSIPRFDHVVIVMEENHNYSDVIGASSAPYINWLAKHGASLTNMQGVTHPSQPNYLALFSGSTAGVSGDTPPSTLLTRPSLGGELLAAGLTFKSYAEGLPSTGSLVSTSGEYARKHNPASEFADVPASDNVPFTQFPTDYSKLPTVSMVIPDLVHDMHNASVHQGDNWLKTNLSGYATWARTHNSLLIVTWDEGHGSNHIPTIFYGQNVKAHASAAKVNHYNILRTLEDMYSLTPLGASANAGSIQGIFSDVAI